jgi:hypothetical protein
MPLEPPDKVTNDQDGDDFGDKAHWECATLVGKAAAGI